MSVTHVPVRSQNIDLSAKSDIAALLIEGFDIALVRVVFSPSLQWYLENYTLIARLPKSLLR